MHLNFSLAWYQKAHFFEVGLAPLAVVTFGTQGLYPPFMLYFRDKSELDTFQAP